MTDTLQHCALYLAAGIVGTSIAIVWLVEGFVGLGLIVAAITDRLVR